MDPDDIEGDEPDVDSSAGSGAVGTGNDARLKLLAEINDKNDLANAEELADIKDDDTTEPFVPAVVKTTEDEEVVAPIETTPAKNEVTPKVFKIKVNGEELELSEAELVERAQKVESADRYLKEAAQRKREAEEAAKPKQVQPTAEELRAQRDEEDKKLVRAIQMGTEEEATAAIRILREQSSARPSVSPDDMSRAIDERLAFNEAVSDFRKNFPVIAKDARLLAMANQRDVELLRNGDTRPYAERFAEIGSEILAWKETIAPTPVKATDPLEEKAAKKAAAPKVPATSTAKLPQAKGEDEDGEEDPHEVIANIAKSRGGPQWMRS